MKNKNFRRDILLGLAALLINTILLYFNYFNVSVNVIGLAHEYQQIGFNYNMFYRGHMRKEIFNELIMRNSNTEIFALLSGGTRGSRGAIIIQADNEKATLKYIGADGEIKTRDLAPLELEDLTTLIKRENVDDLRHLYKNVRDGMEYMYLHITEGNVYQVYIDNPGIAAEGSIYDLLVKNFFALVEQK